MELETLSLEVPARSGQCSPFAGALNIKAVIKASEVVRRGTRAPVGGGLPG